MTARTLLDQLATRAADAEPPALDDAAARRFVDAALVRATSMRPRGERRPVRRVPVWTFAVAAAALAAVLAWPLRRAQHASSELARVTLPSGDRLVGDAARFEVAGDRRVHLDDGALVVGAVARGTRFELSTPHVVVTTSGAVFSIDSAAARSRVQVYRGDVDVEQAGAHHHVVAGAVWNGQVIVAGSSTTLPPALAGAIDELLTSDVPPVADAAAAPTTAVQDPVPTPGPPVVAEPAPAKPSEPTRDRVVGDEPAPTKPSESAPDPVVVDEPAPAKPALSRDELFARASTELRNKQFDRALATAAIAKARGAMRGPWRVLTADALRGLRRLDDAATAYQRAAAELQGLEASTAGYTAAYLRFHDLRDPAGALAALDAAHVDDPGSPLEERGLALRIRALLALDRRDAARPFAARYLAAYPSSELRPLVQSIVDR